MFRVRKGEAWIQSGREESTLESKDEAEVLRVFS
jgi:hypothetical protein